MSKTITSFAWCLLVTAATALASFAGPSWIKAEREVTVAVGDMIPFQVEIDADEVQYRFLGTAAKGFREYDPDPKRLVLQILGREDGYAYAIVVGAKAGKLLSPEIITVKVGNGSKPQPKPDPKPDPLPPQPGPDDVSTIAAALVVAAKAEGWTRTKLEDASVAYGACALLAKRATTSDKFFEICTATLQRTLDKPVPKAVQAVLNTELAWVPAPDTKYTFTDADRTRLAKSFERMSSACEMAAAKGVGK